MKKIKFTGKLSLNKETVTKLNDKQMGKVEGGGTFTNGCTDGCTSKTSLGSAWNCSAANCTADCTGFTCTCALGSCTGC